MEKLVMGLILLVIAIVLFVIKVPKPLTQIKKIVGSLLGLAAVVMIVFAGFDYNDTGRTKHIRTIFGTENAVFNTGWYFSGWGKTTNWMHEYTVSHVQNPAEMQGTSVNGLYTIRMADNWRGEGFPNDPIPYATRQGAILENGTGFPLSGKHCHEAIASSRYGVT